MMPGYSSSSALRVLVAGMQVIGCFVYVWPDCYRRSSSFRKGPKDITRITPSVGLCLWNAGVTLLLLTWLVFEMYFIVTNHKTICIGELAHVVAVLLNIIALVVLPVLLLARSKQLFEVLGGLDGIQNPHGPCYLSLMSQVLHVMMSLVACGFISWSYISFEGIAVLWKPIYAFLNIFVVARVFLITLLFRFLFHSLASEIVHATHIVVQEYAHELATTQHDLKTTNSHDSRGPYNLTNSTVSLRVTNDFAATQHEPNLDDHSYDDESGYLPEYEKPSKGDLDVGDFITMTRYDPKTSNDYNYDCEESRHPSNYPMNPKDDLKPDNDFTDTKERDQNTDHKERESKNLYKNPKSCTGDSEVDIACLAKRKVDNEVINRRRDAVHLSSPPCAGEQVDSLLHTLAKLEQKIHLVSEGRNEWMKEKGVKWEDKSPSISPSLLLFSLFITTTTATTTSLCQHISSQPLLILISLSPKHRAIPHIDHLFFNRSTGWCIGQPRISANRWSSSSFASPSRPSRGPSTFTWRDGRPAPSASTSSSVTSTSSAYAFWDKYSVTRCVSLLLSGKSPIMQFPFPFSFMLIFSSLYDCSNFVSICINCINILT